MRPYRRDRPRRDNRHRNSQELVGRSSALQSVSLMTVPPLRAEDLALVPGVEDVTWQGDRVRFTTATVSRTIAALMSTIDARGAAVSDLEVRKATLEDVLIELTSSALRD